MKKLLCLTLLCIAGCSADPTDECAEFNGIACIEGKTVINFTHPPRDVYVEVIIGTILLLDHPPSIFSHGVETRYIVEGNKVIIDPYVKEIPNTVIFFNVKWRCGEKRLKSPCNDV